MSIAATIATAVVIFLHFMFGYAESFGWNAMAERFGYDREKTEITRALATNQGAYNAGLAGVLTWALITGEASTVAAMLVYVIAMAIVGAATAKVTILVIQGLPAILALILVLMS